MTFPRGLPLHETNRVIREAKAFIVTTGQVPSSEIVVGTRSEATRLADETNGSWTRVAGRDADDALAASPIRATIDYLRACQKARAAGYPVRFATDPAWLVDQAINRRAGWLESPHGDTSRGTSQPIDGHFPRKCAGDWQRHLALIAREINTPRRVVHFASLGEHRWLADRLPHRFSH